jgi:hypothetical protein
MRRLQSAVLAAALIAAPGAGAAAAGAKHALATGTPAKRAAERCPRRTRCAQVRRLVTRASHERLVDAPVGDAPVPPPTDPMGAPPAATPLPTFVSAAAREFSLTLSRPLVGAGNVRIELRNSGEDPHNLVVSPDGTHTPPASFSTLDPGRYERHTVELAPGRYQLWCSLEGHEAKGMSVTLRVQ